MGFANGSLLNVLPKDGTFVESLKEIGILNQRGTEFFYGCATFPLYDLNGNPVGFYGRRLDAMQKGKSAAYLYLPGERGGLFNWQTVKAHKEIILTEAIIDSLVLIDAGIKNTIPCYGTNGFTENHLSLFKAHGVERIYVCFDADASGQTASQKVLEKRFCCKKYYEDAKIP